MLIEFSVANYRSFKERKTFSLVKDKGNELEDTNSFQTNTPNKIHLLSSAAIYGPNASGKSNLLLALHAMDEMVRTSASMLQPDDELPLTPFRLCETSAQEPSEFEVIFISDDVRYQYGFTASTDQIFEEWLFAYPNGKSQRWFQRAWDPSKETHVWEFGKKFTGEKQLWQKATRNNALFLSTAIQLNSEQLKPVYNWFARTLRIINLNGVNSNVTASRCAEKDKDDILNFLQSADLNIRDVIIEKETFDPDVLPDDMHDAVKSAITRDLKDKELISIKTVHEGNQGQLVEFEFEDESDGTQKLFNFAGPWLESLKYGYVLFIDELHCNLHPNLVRYLVQMFHNKKTNPNNAQLIFTTHETSILHQEVFRRDQIWFCEKEKDQSTNLYALTDFSPRKGRENLELAYLTGRYGALPFINKLAPKEHRT